MPKKLDKDEFIEKAIKIHGNKYCYDNVIYMNVSKKIIIGCNIHGDFEQVAKNHLDGYGCVKCGYKKLSDNKMTMEQRIKKRNNKIITELIDEIIENTFMTIQQKTKHNENTIKFINESNSIYNDKYIDGKIIFKDKFIGKANIIHNNKYIYDKIILKNSETKIIIICKEHGEFLLKPTRHLMGHGCQKCAMKNNGLRLRKTKEDFIKKAIETHGNKYNYDEIDYKGNKVKIKIKCNEPNHGTFIQMPIKHLQGHGCSVCALIKNKMANRKTTEEFINEANIVHNNKYDYTNVEYVNSTTPVNIICKSHGIFKQSPAHHLKSQNCPKCKNIQYSKISIVCLNFLASYYKINIQHAENDGEYKIPHTRYKADGYTKEINTIWEFHGRFTHGSPKHYNLNDTNKLCNKTYKELYEKTLKKEKIIRDLGYKLIVIWDYQWENIIKYVKRFQRKFLKRKK
jgi:Zn ribbon nucleic-acid-binding protein